MFAKKNKKPKTVIVNEFPRLQIKQEIEILTGIYSGLEIVSAKDIAITNRYIVAESLDLEGVFSNVNYGGIDYIIINDFDSPFALLNECIKHDIIYIIYISRNEISEKNRSAISKIQNAHEVVLKSINCGDFVINCLKFSSRKHDVLREEEFSSEEFFMYEMVNGLHPGNKEYYNLHDETTNLLISEVNPKSAVEFGAGTGLTLELFLSKGVNAIGYDISKLSKLFFEVRNPWFSNKYKDHSFIDSELEHVDLAYSIEVFEHIPDEILLPFIPKISKMCNYFAFSSTPYKSTPRFDHLWGHINLKEVDEWIRLFESNNLKLVKRLHLPTEWSLLFKSEK